MELLDLGRKGYLETLEIQKKVLEERIAGRIPDTLILVEHSPIYTVGRAMSKTQEYPQSIVVPDVETVPVLAVDRGGKMTWHGPGQVVGYPIFKLAHKDVRRYLRDIEKVLCASVQMLGLPGRPTPENLELEAGQLETGLWVGDRKIGSIGIHVKQWVSYHGFALNVHPDLRYFSAIEPCGFRGNIMSSVVDRLGAEASVDPAADTAHAKAELFARTKDILTSAFQELADYYEEVALAQPNAGRDPLDVDV